MRRLLRSVLLAAVAVVFAAILFGIKLLADAGQFKSLVPASAWHCERLPGIAGAEDGVADRATGIVYFSSADWRARSAEAPRGKLFALDPATGRLTDITPAEPRDFLPLGIDLHRDAEGARRLFVVNRAAGQEHRVEIFTLEDPFTARHRETVSDTAFHALNDVAAAGPRQFYVTNDHGHAGGWRRALEDYLRTNEAGALYFDGTLAQPAASGLTFANGIALSPDGRAVYIAETTDRAVRVYLRDPASGVLSLTVRIELHSGPDNISVDEDGSLWVAAHPKLFTLLAHMRNERVPSPSEVLRLVRAGDTWSVRQVYLTAGDEISAASVAVPVAGRVALGAIFGPGILLCRNADAAAGQAP